MPKANIALKYNKVGNFEFSSLMQKLASAQVDNKTACMIRGVWKESERARKHITETYKKEIMEVFATRDEKGEILVPEDGSGFKPMEDKVEEFKKAQDEFGEREFVFEYGPLRPSHLKDIKLSGKELDILGDLFNEEDGPGVPQIGF